MKKKGVIVLAFALAIAGAFIYLLSNGGSKSVKEEMQDMQTTQAASTPTVPEETPTDSITKPILPDGAYIDYKDGIIASTSGTKLLFFHAPWCPQCRDVDSDIKAKGVPRGVSIIKVDYDSNQALRKKYGVTIQTTIVKVNDNGEFIAKYVAYNDPTLKAITENLL